MLRKQGSSRGEPGVRKVTMLIGLRLRPERSQPARPLDPVDAAYRFHNTSKAEEAAKRKPEAAVSAKGDLSRYREIRDFSKTPEPSRRP